MNKRVWLIVIALAILVALTAPVRAGSERIERTLTHETPLSEGQSIRVENLIGSLTIRADKTDGKVLVEATVVTEADAKETAKALNQSIELAQDEQDGTPVIRVVYPLDRHSAFRLPRSERDGIMDKWVNPIVRKSTVAAVYDGQTVEVGQGKGAAAVAVHVKVTIPLEVNAAFKQVAGTLHVVGVRGDFSLEAVDGHIVAEQIYGSMQVRTGGGEVIVRKFGGEGFRLQSASGDVTLMEVKAQDASLRAGSGRIEGSGITAASLEVDSGVGGVHLDGVDSVNIEVASESGDVDIAALLTRTKQASIRSAVGNVTLRVNKTTPFELKAFADSGSVKHRDVSAEVIDEEKNSLHLLRGNKGGAALEINTGKGAVMIRPI
jgi:DUF4097 and DUF4098 domain-containing protein YvlB